MAKGMKLGVLTGGGDCAGLNAAVRAVVIQGLRHQFEVVGIRDGWAGLVNLNASPIDRQWASGLLHVGGTKLGTSRTNPAKSEELMAKVMDNTAQLGLDALIAIGGDDTLGVASKLNKRGVPVVGIPKTMDNDVMGTDYCIGFDTAVNVVMEALGRLHTTADSHHRVLVAEVMGRDAGWVALYGGLAGGADYILIPEVTKTIEDVIMHLERRTTLGKRFSVIAASEGIHMPELVEEDRLKERDAFGHVRLSERGVGESLAKLIEKHTKFETRSTVLGHLQRGGAPTVLDRVIATRFGIMAVDLVQDRRYGLMTAYRQNTVVPEDLDVVAQGSRRVPPELYEALNIFE